MRKQLLIDLQEDIFEKLEHFAQSRGLEIEEAIRFIIGESLLPIMATSPIPAPAAADPMDALYKMMEGTGMCTCRQCTQRLTADEIKKHGSLCFKCKPDLDKLYDNEPEGGDGK